MDTRTFFLIQIKKFDKCSDSSNTFNSTGTGTPSVWTPKTNNKKYDKKP